MRPSTIRGRATLGATAVVGVALLAVSIALLVILRRSQVERERTAASARAADIVGALEAGTPIADLRLDESDDRFVQVLDANGAVLAASASVIDKPRLDTSAASAGDSDDQFVIVSSPVASDEAAMVVVGREVDSAEESVGALAALLAIAGPLLLGIVGATTWRVVGVALQPVAEIRREAEEIGVGDLHRRVPEPDSGDEIADLAATMNRMLERLEASQQRQRRLVSDASHELRSPVAAIRQLAEVAIAHPDRTSVSELADGVLAEDLRVQSVVEDLLVLARADERSLSLHRVEVDLDDLVFDHAARLRANTELAVEVSAVSAGRVQGDGQALDRVVRNLVDNAARHAERSVAFAVTESDDFVTLTIDDDGDGVPPEQRERIFERFVRLDEARTRDDGGSGLGLAIVAELVAMHDGEVHVAQGRLGGASFEVRLPRP